MNANTKIIVINSSVPPAALTTLRENGLTVFETASETEALAMLKSDKNPGGIEPDEAFFVLPSGYITGKKMMKPFAPGFGRPGNTTFGEVWGLQVYTDRATKYGGFAQHFAAQLLAWTKKASPHTFPWGPARKQKKVKEFKPGSRGITFVRRPRREGLKADLR